MKTTPAQQGLQRIRVGIEFASVPPETNTKLQLFVQLLIFTNLA